MQLFRALRANIGLMCVNVTLRNVTGRAREKACNGGMVEGEDQEKTKDEDCGQRARRLGPTFILHIMILYYSLCMYTPCCIACARPSLHIRIPSIILQAQDHVIFNTERKTLVNRQCIVHIYIYI